MKRKYLNYIKSSSSQKLRNRISPIFRYFEDLFVTIKSHILSGKTPDFLIIGAQKAATTSLYDIICECSEAKEIFRKEIGYFDRKYIHYNFKWYCSNFPKKHYCGEATPDYFYSEMAPELIKSKLPQIKLILILRDPIERAISHYNHEVRLGRENLSFKEAIKLEEARIGAHYYNDKDIASNYTEMYRNHYYSYISRGMYAKQLKKWMMFFPPEQIFILDYTDITTNNSDKLYDLFEFLGLKLNFSEIKFRSQNKGTYKKTEYYRDLEPAIFEYDMRQLYSLLEEFNVSLSWLKRYQ